MTHFQTTYAKSIQFLFLFFILEVMALLILWELLIQLSNLDFWLQLQL